MFDFHMHSSVSYDATATVEEMLDGALLAGLKEICFTDHYDFYTDPSKTPSAFTLPQYRAAYAGVTRPGLVIRRGLELGLTAWNKQQAEAVSRSLPFDFVIGSVHVVDEHDPYYPEYWQHRTVEKAFCDYLEQVYRCVQCHDCYDVLGHLTYVCKSAHNPTHAPLEYAPHREIIDAILMELVKKDKGMEINTSGVDKAGVFLPSEPFLRRFRELGGRIVTVGSDAHDPGRVGQYVPEALELLKDIFGYVCTFQNRQPVFHKL